MSRSMRIGVIYDKDVPGGPEIAAQAFRDTGFTVGKLSRPKPSDKNTREASVWFTIIPHADSAPIGGEG